MTTSDDWVKHATTDDSLVAELLLRLAGKPPSPSLDWTVRQRRSRAPATMRELKFDAEMKRQRRKRKNKTEQTRASPTTPLSWSPGNSSVSGGDGDFSDDLRSKVSVKNEAMSTTSKRPRKKKTLAELREEENLLLKERKKLRKEVEIMRLGIKEQRATNEALNRLKLDLECKKKFEARQRSVAPSLSDNKTKDVQIRETGFPLPDLNLPVDGDLV